MYPVGVRQVAYHLSSEGLIEKKERDFDIVSDLIGEMREDSKLPWTWIVDNTRNYTLTHLQHLEQTADGIIESERQAVAEIPEMDSREKFEIICGKPRTKLERCIGRNPDDHEAIEALWELHRLRYENVCGMPAIALAENFETFETH